MKQPDTKNEAEKWMPVPDVDTEYPGLAYIYPLDQLIITRKIDAFHKIIGKKGICYTIFNNLGQKVFLAVQETHCKKFDLKIFNFYGNEVMQVKRPFKLCINRVFVWAPSGNFVGTAEQVRFCANTFLVKNRFGKVMLKIKAQGLCHLIYDVLSDNEQIGVITNEWRIRACLNMTTFCVTFPADMDVTEKAVLLGASFLIGYLKYL